MTPLRPSKIVCVGRNYVEHAKELGNAVPERPLLFFKPPSALIGPGRPIVLPRESTQVEHEAEIGVVIGRPAPGRRPRSRRSGASRGSSVSTTSPRATAEDRRCSGRGPRGSTPSARSVRAVVRASTGARWRSSGGSTAWNGSGGARQRDAVRHSRILLAYISGIMTLEPGDLVATGTPAGVGPLTPGDVVEVEIPGVGILSNPVRSEAAAMDRRPAAAACWPSRAIRWPRCPASSGG